MLYIEYSSSYIYYIMSKKTRRNKYDNCRSWKKYDITPDTLRYYERIGLLRRVPRNQNGIRNYDEESCKRIEFIKCMRSAGVELEKQKNINATLERLDYKIEIYEEIEAGKRKDFTE